MMVVAVFRLTLNPAVRSVIWGFVFTLIGSGILLMEWKDERERRRRGATKAPWDWRREILAWIGGCLFVAAGLAYAVLPFTIDW